MGRVRLDGTEILGTDYHAHKVQGCGGAWAEKDWTAEFLISELEYCVSGVERELVFVSASE